MDFVWPSETKGRFAEKNQQIFFHFSHVGRINHKNFTHQLGDAFQLVSVSSFGKPLTIRIRSLKGYKITTEKHQNTWRFILMHDAQKSAKLQAHRIELPKIKQPDIVSATIKKKPSDKKKPTKKVLQQKRHTVKITWNKKTIPTLSFDWPIKAEMAAFWRGPYFWIVFDRGHINFLTKALTNAKKEGDIRDFLVGGNKDFSWIRLLPSRMLFPKTSGNDLRWEISWHPSEQAPIEPLAFGVEKGKFGKTQAFIMVPEPDSALKLQDPLFRDTLWIIPLRQTGHAFPMDKDLTQFSLLTTAQGIVIVPKADDLSTAFQKNKVILSSPDGILIAENNEPTALSESEAMSSLLHFYYWKRNKNPWVKTHEELKKASFQTQGAKKIQATMDLARFYLESGMDAEGMAALRFLLDGNPSLKKDASFIALTAVAEIMDRRFKEAEKTLENPILAKDPEMRVWRGAMKAMKGEWRDANRDMKYVSTFVKTYPDHLKNALLLSASEVAAMVGHTMRTKDLISNIDPTTLSENQTHFLHYVKGLIAKLEGNKNAALVHWKKALEEGDKLTKTKAGLALVHLALEDEKPNLAAQIDQLERLKYGWRGDHLEFEILKLLSTLYIQNKQYKKGFNSLTYLKNNTPWKEKMQDVDDLITNNLTPLILEANEESDLVQILSLFEEFKSLLKKKSNHIQVFYHVVKLYTKIDLLDRAIDLLEEVEKGIQDDKKNPYIIERINLYIQNEGYTQARKVLDAWSPKDANMQKIWRLLKARTLYAAQKTPEALKIIENDDSIEAYTLRAFIYQQEKNWSMTGDMYLKLMQKTKRKALQDDYLLQAALSFALAQEKDSLDTLRRTYATKINLSRHKSVFDLLLTTKNVPDTKTLIDLFKQYKKVLPQTAKNLSVYN